VLVVTVIVVTVLVRVVGVVLVIVVVVVVAVELVVVAMALIVVAHLVRVVGFMRVLVVKVVRLVAVTVISVVVVAVVVATVVQGFEMEDWLANKKLRPPVLPQRLVHAASKVTSMVETLSKMTAAERWLGTTPQRSVSRSKGDCGLSQPLPTNIAENDSNVLPLLLLTST